MALNTYNNNQDSKPTVNVYTPLTFANPNSKVQQTRLSISYFNRLMQWGIAKKNGNGSNDSYVTYDNDNQVKVFISYRIAKMLHDGILKMMEPNSGISNVCYETKNGLIKISNGVEYGSETYCISITYNDSEGGVGEAIYQTKHSDELAYNYNDGNYESMRFENFEIDTIVMVLEEYYKAASYAVAASIREATMYRDKWIHDMINSIAIKTDAKQANGGSGGKYSNKTFLNNNNGSSSSYSGGSNGSMNGVPKEYEQSSFDDIVNGMDID